MLGAPSLGFRVPQFGGTFVVGLFLFGFLLLGIEFGNTEVGLGVFLVDSQGALVTMDGFPVFSHLGVGASDESQRLSLLWCDT